ncbi:alpha-protein kinase vwka [Anaeramoeba flamelloides]|uniref:Alpha-protein kinase vwka n=1 Tax=Anaeramoeba flamelloides TaxID=1746091 RepID=A0ABQ8X893_9EUKA|nr:alpha-protein kinase vwka [Anaeramoeba flamelloides]
MSSSDFGSDYEEATSEENYQQSLSETSNSDDHSGEGKNKNDQYYHEEDEDEDEDEDEEDNTNKRNQQNYYTPLPQNIDKNEKQNFLRVENWLRNKDNIAKRIVEFKKEAHNQARSLDICFLVDLTVAMVNHLKKLIEYIPKIVDILKKEYPVFKIRIAFVGYREFNTDKRFQVLKWIKIREIEKLKTFLKTVKSEGGDGKTADVLGGLYKVLELNWTSEVNLLIHIGNAPCHGEEYQNTFFSSKKFNDGDPSGKVINKIITKLLQRQIDYAFFSVSKKTQKMISKFEDVYLKNSKNDLRFIVTHQFNQKDLYGFRENILKIIVEMFKKAKRRIEQATTVIRTGLKKQKMKLEGETDVMNPKEKVLIISIDVNTKIEDILLKKQLNWIEREITIQTTKHPSDIQNNVQYYKVLTHDFASNLVIKKDNQQRSVSLKRQLNRCQNKVITQFLAKKLAMRFNLLKPYKAVDFLEKHICYFQFRQPQVYCTIEPALEGKIIRYNDNNHGKIANGIHTTAQTFSHWTYHHMQKRCIVVSLQGINYILTDPVIHTKHGGILGKTDRGSRGATAFFQTHVCTPSCRHLKLHRRGNKLEIKNSGKMTLVKDIYYRLVCSQEFCGNPVKVVAKDIAKNQLHFCETCKPQQNQFNAEKEENDERGKYQNNRKNREKHSNSNRSDRYVSSSSSGSSSSSNSSESSEISDSPDSSDSSYSFYSSDSSDNDENNNISSRSSSNSSINSDDYDNNSSDSNSSGTRSDSSQSSSSYDTPKKKPKKKNQKKKNQKKRLNQKKKKKKNIKICLIIFQHILNCF